MNVEKKMFIQRISRRRGRVRILEPCQMTFRYTARGHELLKKGKQEGTFHSIISGDKTRLTFQY